MTPEQTYLKEKTCSPIKQQDEATILNLKPSTHNTYCLMHRYLSAVCTQFHEEAVKKDDEIILLGAFLKPDGRYNLDELSPSELQYHLELDKGG